MKLDKYNKLKDNLETFGFERNFSTLDKVLYYFSFLGNIFLILFSYYFIVDVVADIPKLFKYQDLFFSIFIILFMTGYELFKRFAFEQLMNGILKIKKFTLGIAFGSIVCLGLIIGSFYLGLNGAHRLVDQTDNIETVSQDSLKTLTDSLNNLYAKRLIPIQNKVTFLYENSEGRKMWNSEKRSLQAYTDQIKELEAERDAKIEKLEEKILSGDDKEIERAKQNDLAFVLITFFLELIILIGVGFHSYYIYNSFTDMKKLLNTPKFRQMETNIKLLKILYQNGRKVEGERTLSLSKFTSLASIQKINTTQKEIKEFIALCDELEITRKESNLRRTYNVNYDKAKSLIQTEV